MNENWVDIKGFEGIYEISDLGRVRNKSNGREIKPHNNGYGVMRVDLYGGDGTNKGISTVNRGEGARRFNLHRLVGEHFVPNPEGYRFLLHHNGNKSECEASNLYWNINSLGENHEDRVSSAW